MRIKKLLLIHVRVCQSSLCAILKCNELLDDRMMLSGQHLCRLSHLLLAVLDCIVHDLRAKVFDLLDAPLLYFLHLVLNLGLQRLFQLPVHAMRC